ncbi:GIY-YIG nuclease family protein [Streptomyces blattellae]|uniref:GIY-YIG nuclease family protein n=1 Tax=Streptomyces blattellae TaxID=2569855 RepID=UPI0012B99022|nr:GIY-YIG nuclease family protein [Streptomyces blattellae]
MNGWTALYRLYDTDGELLYIGVTGNIATRWSAHASDKEWWPQVARRELTWFASRDEALAEEQRAIWNERPRHNRQHAFPKVSAEAARVFAGFKQAKEEEAELWPLVRARAIEDMRAGATVSQLAEWTGRSRETFRRIARAEGIERLREPTVRRLKDDD